MRASAISMPGEPLKKVCPSQAGGNNYWPSSYSPKTKLLYIPALSNCVTITIDREKHNAQRGWNGGLSTTDDRWESNLTAVDPLTGEIKKTVHLRYPNYSGTLATGGGLVFLALLDGTVAAYDDTTLDELWKINVGSGFSAPPMTFEVNGKQYIAIVSGPSPVARRQARQHAGTQGAAQRPRAVRVRAVSVVARRERSAIRERPYCPARRFPALRAGKPALHAGYDLKLGEDLMTARNHCSAPPSSPPACSPPRPSPPTSHQTACFMPTASRRTG